jgi:hypothetical protein
MARSKYEADNGQIHLINLDADRLAEAGTPPAGDSNSSIRAKVSKTNREYGIRPRGVRLARTVGTAPDTFVKYSFLPVLTPAAFNGAGFSLGGSITIGTIQWEIIARINEDF